jgi:plastocyanin
MTVLLVACSNTQSPANRRKATGSATASVLDGVQTITVNSDASLRFNPSTITVHPGPVELVLTNSGGEPHNWTLLGLPGAATATIGDGQQTTLRFTAPAPGSYQFVCTIHQRQGMTGTLVVLPG